MRRRGGVKSSLLCDLLRQNLPAEVSLKELLEAGGEHRQLLGVKVLLGGRKEGVRREGCSQPARGHGSTAGNGPELQ